jgi:hypothetical protein
MWMGVIGTDLARFPAGDGDVAAAEPVKDGLDVAGRVESFLLAEIKNFHGFLLERSGWSDPSLLC